MNDAHCAEMNEQSIFQFLFFELWLILFTIFGDALISKRVTTKKKIPSIVTINMEDVQRAETNEKSIYRFLDLEILSIFYGNSEIAFR